MIRQIEAFDGGAGSTAATIAATIVSRTKSVDWLVEHVEAIDASVGARLVGMDFNRRVAEICDDLKKVNDSNDIRRSFQQLFDRDDRHELLSDIAEKAPIHLWAAMWRQFVQIAEILARDVRHPDRTYRRIWEFEMDRGLIPPPPVVHALRIALRRFAEMAAKEFMAFAVDHAVSDVLTIHALLIEGLETAAATYPKEVLEYLLADPRRLAIGPEGERYADSARLIAAIHPKLDDVDRRMLVSAISSCTPYAADASDDVEKRRAVARWNRQHRLGLLKALDTRLIDDSLRRHIAAEDRFFGGESPLRRAARTHWIGPRMKKEEIEKASDGNLFKLLDELTDEMPRRVRDTNVNPERSGGAEQLAHEIGKAVERSPERALRLIQHLDPAKHQSYAPSLIESLIRAGVDLDTLHEVVQQLDERGFRTTAFCQSVGWELHERGKGVGLSDGIVEMLERWIEEMPTNGEGESHFAQDRQRQPILSGWHFGGGWPSRGSVFAGFSTGVLDRATPAIDRWIKRVRRDIGRESSLSFWEFVIGQMATCLNEDATAANAVLADIIAACPALLERVMVLACLGNYSGVLEPARLRVWLSQMLSTSTPVSQQGWGELLMIQRDLGENDSRTIAGVLESDRTEAILGLCYGAGYVWNIEKRRAAAGEILITAVDRFGVDCADPLSHFLRHLEEVKFIDIEAERVIRAILTSPALIEKLVTELLAVVEACATANPALTYEVTKRLLDVGWASIGNPSGLFFSHAGDLTTLALTLHRQSAYRAAGLELFERLIALNVYEAEAALELLDRRAARRYTPRPRRRVPRRPRQPRPSNYGDGKVSTPKQP